MTSVIILSRVIAVGLLSPIALLGGNGIGFWENDIESNSNGIAELNSHYWTE